jgi:hypothetical protein
MGTSQYLGMEHTGHREIRRILGKPEGFLPSIMSRNGLANDFQFSHFNL